MRAEFCIIESNAPGLKANFYEPYVDKPTAGPNDLSFSSVYLAVKKAESLLDSGENHCEQIFACLPCWQWAIS